MKDSKAFWDKTARRYAKNPVRDVETYQKKLAITQGYFQSDWSVLEFGCGAGSIDHEWQPNKASVFIVARK